VKSKAIFDGLPPSSDSLIPIFITLNERGVHGNSMHGGKQVGRYDTDRHKEIIV
jgi:hypothetical protein